MNQNIYYVGLSKTKPKDDGSNITVPKDRNYKKVKLLDLNQVVFGSATIHWGKISYFFITDKFGRIIASNRFDEPKKIKKGDTAVLKIKLE